MFVVSGLFIAVSIVLGGGTHSGFMSDVWLQYLALPLLLVSIWKLLDQDLSACLFIGVACAVLIIPLLPLPAAITGWYWSERLPLNLEPEVGQLSLSPSAGWAALMSMLPPLGVYLAVSQLSLRHRTQLAVVIVVLGSISAIVGFMQFAQGPDSPWRFYEITNDTEAVGFFANRNHLSALLYVTLVLLSPWLILATSTLLDGEVFKSRGVLAIAVLCALVLLIVTGLALARSRSGIFLAMGAFAGIGLMVRSLRFSSSVGGRRKHVLVATFFVFAALFAVQFGFHRLQARFSVDPVDDLRVAFNGTTWDAVLASLPLGTGLGSFVQVYSIYEKQADLFIGFANRAHNDLLEVTLETGLPGLIVLAFIGYWLARRSVMVWRRTDTQCSTVDILMRRACTLSIALLLAHSLVDYPLRTTALSVIFAYCCAVISPAPIARNAFSANRPRKEAATGADSSLKPAQSAGIKRLESFSDDTIWPEQWKS